MCCCCEGSLCYPSTVCAPAPRPLQIVKHRSYLDPKQHFKTAGEDRKAGLPKFFQMGTVQVR